MTLTALQIAFLQSLAQNPTVRHNSKSAEFFGQHYALGRQVGRQWEYTLLDAEKAAGLLQALGLPVAVRDPSAPNDRASAAARPGLSEKGGTVAPHADSVAFTVLGQPMPCGSAWLSPQPFGYQVATVVDVASCAPHLVVLVENLETFRNIRRYEWLLATLPPQESTLVLYRGDTRLKVEDSLAALRRLRAPVWGAFDFDPAGLGMAAAVKGLERVLLPRHEVLQSAVLQGARFDLWADQQEQYYPALERCQNAAIREPWEWMKTWKRGLPQEWMQGFGAEAMA